MNSRSILFIFLSTAIMMLAMTLRPAPDVGQHAPDKDSLAASTQTSQPGAGDEGGGTDSLAAEASVSQAEKSSSDGEAPEPLEKDASEIQTASDSASAPDESPKEIDVDDGSNGLTDSQIEELIAERKPENANKNAILNAWDYRASEKRRKLTSVGSLAPDSGERYLLTINSRGGTLRRVEVNSRDFKGRLRYRDGELRYGFIGSLELEDSPEGCIVGVVGHGTPAFNATSQAAQGGLAAGDVINSFNDQPVPDRYEFELMLADTKSGEDATIGVLRDGSPISFALTLGQKPIELIRPEPSQLDPKHSFTESFSLMLKKPYDEAQRLWDSIDAQMEVADWEISRTNINGNDAVEARFVLGEDLLTPLGLKGPIEVVKRYILPKVSEEDLVSVNSRSWHWNLEIEVFNRSDVNQKLGYSLVGPTGTPSETWWYANKIFGGNSFTGVAGARDVTSSTPDRPYHFLSGNEILTNTGKTPPEPTFIISPFDTTTYPEKGQWNWVGVDSQYFNVSLINTDNLSSVNNLNAVTNGAELPDNAKLKRLVDCTCLIYEDFEVPAGGSIKRTFEVFSGPKDHDALIHYGLDDNRAFGWFWWCSKPLLWVLNKLYVLTFSVSYALPIILLTIMVRILMIPFSRKAALNAQMMQALQPQMKEIADKYEDMQERGMAQRELFKKHNYQPLGGCLVMFIQLPIFLGLYRGLSADIALRDQPLWPGLGWCSDLSAPDQFLYWKDWMPAVLGSETGWLGPYLNILPLATIVLFYVQQKMFTPPAVDEQQKMMQKMMGFMMLFMGLMFFKVPSGLCLYFITSSIWAILEKKLLPKPVLDTSSLGLGEAVSATPLSKAKQKLRDEQNAAVEEKKKRIADRKKRGKNR